jgi:hypothetical protein
MTWGDGSSVRRGDASGAQGTGSGRRRTKLLRLGDDAGQRLQHAERRWLRRAGCRQCATADEATPARERAAAIATTDVVRNECVEDCSVLRNPFIHRRWCLASNQ